MSHILNFRPQYIIAARNGVDLMYYAIDRIVRRNVHGGGGDRSNFCGGGGDSSSFCGGAKVKNLACAALIAVPQFNYTCIKKHAKSVKEHGSVLLFPETSGEVQTFYCAR